jgi:hypothetical protein
VEHEHHSWRSDRLISASMSGWRINSRYRRPIGSSEKRSARRAASFASCTTPTWSTTTTPSTMPARIASIRARSRVRAASEARSRWTVSSSRRADSLSSSEVVTRNRVE